MLAAQPELGAAELASHKAGCVLLRMGVEGGETTTALTTAAMTGSAGKEAFSQDVSLLIRVGHNFQPFPTPLEGVIASQTLFSLLENELLRPLFLKAI